MRKMQYYVVFWLVILYVTVEMHGLLGFYKVNGNENLDRDGYDGTYGGIKHPDAPVKPRKKASSGRASSVKKRTSRVTPLPTIAKVLPQSSPDDEDLETRLNRSPNIVNILVKSTVSAGSAEFYTSYCAGGVLNVDRFHASDFIPPDDWDDGEVGNNLVNVNTIAEATCGSIYSSIVAAARRAAKEDEPSVAACASAAQQEGNAPFGCRCVVELERYMKMPRSESAPRCDRGGYDVEKVLLQMKAEQAAAVTCTQLPHPPVGELHTNLCHAFVLEYGVEETQGAARIYDDWVVIGKYLKRRKIKSDIERRRLERARLVGHVEHRYHEADIHLVDPEANEQQREYEAAQERAHAVARERALELVRKRREKWKEQMVNVGMRSDGEVEETKIAELGDDLDCDNCDAFKQAFANPTFSRLRMAIEHAELAGVDVEEEKEALRQFAQTKHEEEVRNAERLEKEREADDLRLLQDVQWKTWPFDTPVYTQVFDIVLTGSLSFHHFEKQSAEEKRSVETLTELTVLKGLKLNPQDWKARFSIDAQNTHGTKIRLTVKYVHKSMTQPFDQSEFNRMRFEDYDNILCGALETIMSATLPDAKPVILRNHGKENDFPENVILRDRLLARQAQVSASRRPGFDPQAGRRCLFTDLDSMKDCKPLGRPLDCTEENYEQLMADTRWEYCPE